MASKKAGVCHKETDVLKDSNVVERGGEQCTCFSCVSEVLYEDETFRSRAFAALVASKVFYHLGAFEESLNYALGAGDLFNVTDDSEYVETIIGEFFSLLLFCMIYLNTLV